MDDLSALLANIMNNPQSVQQLRSAAEALGLTGAGEATPPQPQQQAPAQNTDINGLLSLLQGGQNNQGGKDLSSLISALSSSQPSSGGQGGLSALAPLLSGLGGNAGSNNNNNANTSSNNMPDLAALQKLLGGGSQPAPAQGGMNVSDLISALSTPQQNAQPAASPDLSGLLSKLSEGLGNAGTNGGGSNAGGIDPSALMSMLGQANTQQQAPKSGFDVSSLTSMLSQGNPAGSTGATSGLPNIDFNMLVMIQKAMSAFSASNQNVELLRALKPRLTTERAKKVDDAIRVMQLLQFYPLIKESGLFGDGSGGGFLSGLFSGGGEKGLIGNLLSSGAGGISSLLGRLNLGGDRG